MVDALCVDFLSATPASFQVNGVSSLQMGGTLHREAAEAPAQGIYEARNSVAKKIQNDVFLLHNTHVYKFSTASFYVPVGTYSTTQANFQAFSAGDAWSSSGGAVGTFSESAVPTDTYVEVIPSSGVVGSGETITITSGAAAGETAVSTAAQTQGGGVGSKGEWVKVYQIATALKTPYSHSGFVTIQINSELGMCGLFISSTNFIHALTYTPSAGWSESGAIDATGDTVTDVFGVATVANQSIVVGINENNTGPASWYFYNPTTGSGSKTSYSRGGGETTWGGIYSHNSHVVEWNGGVYAMAMSEVPNSTRTLIILKLSGGAWVEAYTNAKAVPGSHWLPSPSRQFSLFTNNGHLYGLMAAVNVAVAPVAFAFALVKFYESGGVLLSDTDNATNPASDQFTHDMLGPNLAIVPVPNSGSTLINGGWKFIQDSETNTPAGIQRTFIYLAGAGIGAPATMDVRLLSGFTAVSDVTYTWNGTVTVATSGPSGILPGSWVKIDNDPTKPAFRVASVGPSSITLTQINSIAIPSGVGIYSLTVGGFVSQGSVAGINQFAFPDTMQPSGGSFYTVGQNTIDVVTHAKANGAVKYTLIPEGGGTMVVRLYVGSGVSVEADTLAPLKNNSAGILVVEGVGHKITGIVADGTPFTVELDIGAAGITSGDVKGVVPRISVA